MNDICLWKGDYLSFYKKIPEHSVDFLITDPPYGMTACDWDVRPDFPEFWRFAHHVVKPSGAIAVYGSQPFSSLLVCSNQNEFRYEWILEKSAGTGHMNVSKRPMRAHENVSVFYREQCCYHAQKETGHRRRVDRRTYNTIGGSDSVYGAECRDTVYDSTERFPRSVLFFHTGSSVGKRINRTQKPVAMYDYFIRTYTDPDDCVLDCFAGSMTCAEAAIRLGRRVICIEKDPAQYVPAVDRIRGVLEEEPALDGWYPDGISLHPEEKY